LGSEQPTGAPQQLPNLVAARASVPAQTRRSIMPTISQTQQTKAAIGATRSIVPSAEGSSMPEGDISAALDSFSDKL
jgi:hypothetical protein